MHRGAPLLALGGLVLALTLSACDSGRSYPVNKDDGEYNQAEIALHQEELPAGFESGQLDPDRLENFQRLGREAAYEARKHDKAAAAEHKRRWKRIHQASKAMYRDRDRR